MARRRGPPRAGWGTRPRDGAGSVGAHTPGSRAPALLAFAAGCADAPAKPSDGDTRPGGGTGAERDPVPYGHAWSVNGVARGDVSSETVPAPETADGPAWSVMVTPDDGVLDGRSAVASVVIGNQPPSAAVPRIDPASPTAEDDLRLFMDAAPIDADGDTVTRVPMQVWEGGV